MRRGRLPTGPLKQLVQMEAQPITIKRRPKQVDSAGDGGIYRDDTSYNGSHTANLALNLQGVSTSIQTEGEVTEGTLVGFCDPNVDIKVGDRIDYGGTTYELDTPPEKVPSPQNPQLLSLTFTAV